MKRFAAVITAGALMLSLAACSSEVDSKETEKPEETTEETTEESTELTDEDMTEPSESETTGEAAGTNVICVWKDYAIDTMGLQNLEDMYSWDGDEDYSHIVIYSEGKVSDFNFYEISNWDVQQDGSFTYDKNMVLWQPSLKANTGYQISLSFNGDLPEYGYSYEDQDGTVRMFIIEISGEDGSIVTIPD